MALPMSLAILHIVNLGLPNILNLSLSISMSAIKPQPTDKKEYTTCVRVSTLTKSIGHLLPPTMFSADMRMGS